MSLVGAWVVDKADARALADLGEVLLEFGEGGELLYTIRGRDKLARLDARCLALSPKNWP